MENEQTKFLTSLKSAALGIFLIFKTSFIIIIIPLLIIIIIISISEFINTKDYKNINASVVEIREMNTKDRFKYEVKLEYIVNNITYHQTINEDQPYKIGETIAIKYNPENPNEFSNDEQFGVIFVLICFAILFGSILILFIKSIKMFYIGLKGIINWKKTPPKEIGIEYIEELRKEENKWK